MYFSTDLGVCFVVETVDSIPQFFRGAGLYMGIAALPFAFRTSRNFYRTFVKGGGSPRGVGGWVKEDVFGQFSRWKNGQIQKPT